MPQALIMLHERDPKLDLQQAVEHLIDLIEPLGSGVLVASYVRPDKTAGGIFLTDNTKAEDDHQGKVGLVLALGPIAFQDDATHRFGKVPDVGDWVVFNVGETFQFKLGKQHVRIVEDVSVRAIVKQPDIIW